MPDSPAEQMAREGVAANLSVHWSALDAQSVFGRLQVIGRAWLRDKGPTAISKTGRSLL